MSKSNTPGIHSLGGLWKILEIVAAQDVVIGAPRYFVSHTSSKWHMLSRSAKRGHDSNLRLPPAMSVRRLFHGGQLQSFGLALEDGGYRFSITERKLNKLSMEIFKTFAASMRSTDWAIEILHNYSTNGALLSLF